MEGIFDLSGTNIKRNFINPRKTAPKFPEGDLKN
jgi:hypothetical protein